VGFVSLEGRIMARAREVARGEGRAAMLAAHTKSDSRQRGYDFPSRNPADIARTNLKTS